MANISSLLIDAKKEFDINAEAGLFVADIGRDGDQRCTISSLNQPNSPIRRFGWSEDKFVSDIGLYEKFKYLEGHSPFIWRQGVKHDAAKVMVLTRHDGTMLNALKEEVNVEEDLIYPFLKSSDLKSKVIENTDRKVIITQTSLKEETDYIASKYPKLWNYLMSHAKYLDNRKSVIYKNRPRFSIFGIGEYAFKPYKVAISGFYKRPNFSLIVPINDKPVMLDDTCYYLNFDTLKSASITWILLNHASVKDFLSSIIFLDAKRPYTKEDLMRINLLKLAESLQFKTVLDLYQKELKRYLDYKITKTDFTTYINDLRRNYS